MSDVEAAEAAPTPVETTDKKGDVSYVCSFLGGFVMHTEEAARESAKRLCEVHHIGNMGIYRIELVDVYEMKPPEEGRTA